MSVQGATIYSDPNGTEWIFVAAGGKVFATGEGRSSLEISINGAPLAGDCSFTQCYDKLILWRGVDAAPLQMETFGGGFVAVTETTSDSGAGTGTQPIPNSDGARFFQNRLFVPFIYTGTKKDFVAVGDVGNYTRYKFPQNAFRFNDGADDDIVDVAPFGRTSMAVFKQKSVRLVDNLVPDSFGDYSAAVSDLVTSTHGLVARNAWVAVGRDLYYVSTRGVTSLQLTEENKVKGVDLPLSAPIEATWNRINWQHRDKIRIGYWDNKLFIALPLDDARVVNTTNLATGSYSYPGTKTVTGLTAGDAYYFELGANDTTLVNSTTTLTRSGFFIAEGVNVAFTGTSLATVTATLHHVPFYNCNTAVAVFDFITGAWAGVDQTDYVTHVKEWLTPTIQGKQRLVAVTEDGLLRLWEQGIEDELITTVANPYVDITVESQPATGKTLRIGTAGATTVTADSSLSSNTGLTWGTSTTALARTNLYAGYSAALWTQPGGAVTQQDWGIRYTSSSSTLQAFSINGVTVKNSGPFDWAYVDIVSGSQITTQPVAMSLTTRAYAMQDPDGKRYQQASLRLATWNPSFSVSGVTDGVNETASIVSASTRDRTLYSIAGVPNWDSTNANDDHGSAWREDYSVALGSGFNFGSGVALELQQDSLVRMAMSQRGNSCQLLLTNSTGRCVLKSVLMDAVAGDRTMGTKYSG